VVAKSPMSAAKRRVSSPGRKIRLTEGVYNTFLLPLDVLEAADPLSTVTHGTDSSGPMWALEARNEEVPYSRKKDNPKRVSTGPKCECNM
jgi:hypothetical protein